MLLCAMRPQMEPSVPRFSDLSHFIVEYAKLIIRQAYSFYNLGNLIDMVMLCCPSLKIPLQGVGTQCWRHANRVSNGLRYPQLLTKSLKFSIHFIRFPLLLEI